MSSPPASPASSFPTPSEWLDLVPWLTEPERQEWEELIAEMEIPLWTPQPGPQMEAYHCQADELFYGGAQGGGKTDLVLGIAATAHHHSIVFRRIFPEARSMIERSREILNPSHIEHYLDTYNESLHRWVLPGGKLIEFGACEHEKDKENYRGRPHDFYAFDEVCQFTEGQYRFIIAWCRSARPGQRCRVVATGNPPTTAEGRWVVAHWAPWLDRKHPNPARTGELRWFVRVQDKDGDHDMEVPNSDPFEWKGPRGTEILKPKSRTFIPALLKDNPILERTGYLSVIQALPEPMRSQALYGDFDAGVADDAWQVIPTAWIESAFARWTPTPPKGQRLNALGVDCARGGPAKMVIANRRANWFGELIKIPGVQVPTGPIAAAHIIKAHEPEADINLDVIGIGSAVYDSLKEMTWVRAHIHAVNAAASLDLFDRSKRFKLVNVRTALWWRLREALDPDHGDNLAICPDRELLADLTSAKYEVRASGLIVEPKEDIIERLGRSPDCADALCLAHWYTGGYSLPDLSKVKPRESDPYRGPQESESRAAKKGFFGRGDR